MESAAVPSTPKHLGGFGGTLATHFPLGLGVREARRARPGGGAGPRPSGPAYSLGRTAAVGRATRRADRTAPRRGGERRPRRGGSDALASPVPDAPAHIAFFGVYCARVRDDRQTSRAAARPDGTRTRGSRRRPAPARRQLSSAGTRTLSAAGRFIPRSREKKKNERRDRPVDRATSRRNLFVPFASSLRPRPDPPTPPATRGGERLRRLRAAGSRSNASGRPTSSDVPACIKNQKPVWRRSRDDP